VVQPLQYFMELISFSIMGILLLAIFCQWFAWKVKLPSILFLLAAGLIIGPISSFFTFSGNAMVVPTNIIPADIFYSFVEISVALILFEGCMTLNFKNIGSCSKVVRNLISIGIIITLFFTTILVHYLCSISWEISALIGGVTSVSGPTVVIPMLRSVRPSSKVSNIIKWEGILIDPVGALVSVLVFSVISANSYESAYIYILLDFTYIVFIGVLFGCVFGFFVGFSLKKHWLPSYLNNLFVIAMVVTCFILSTHIQQGAGLISVTFVGIILANMKDANIEDILDFKENLSVLLISILFIMLAANISLDNIEKYLWPSIIVIFALQFIVRPLSVFICAFRSNISLKEKPTQDLANEGHILQMITFFIIIGTVVFQSLTAPALSKLLGVSLPADTGFLLIGASKFSQEIAKALQDVNMYVMLADTNWKNLQKARLSGIPTYYGNVTSEHADWHLDLVGIGKMLGLSSNEQINTLSAIKYYREFGAGNVFILPAEIEKATIQHSTDKKYSQKLFEGKLNYNELNLLLENGSQIKTTKLSNEFTWEQYLAKNTGIIPLFMVSPKGNVEVVTSDEELEPTSNWSIISLS